MFGVVEYVWPLKAFVGKDLPLSGKKKKLWKLLNFKLFPVFFACNFARATKTKSALEAGNFKNVI